MSVADLVRQWAPAIDAVEGDVLDLACGAGQNGLFVAKRDFEARRRNRKIILLDRHIDTAVQCTAEEDEGVAAHVEHMQVDLETEENPTPLPSDAFGAIMVFKYLHRPLFANLRDAVRAGGIVLYKTFTWEHPSLAARPRNPAFLLRPSELKNVFAGWEVLDFFEGVEEVAEGNQRTECAVSSIVCRKPR